MATVEKVVSVLRRWQRNHESFSKKGSVTSFSRHGSARYYEDLPDPGPLNADQDNEYVVRLRKLDAHFQPEENVPYK